MGSAPAIDHATELGLRVRELRELPPLSPVAQRLIEMLADDRVAVSPLAQTIELDPGLTARIVGLARSAFFGYGGVIYTVRDAIVRVLGLETVKSLALSLVLSGQLRTGAVPGFNLSRYWSAALLTAAATRSLAHHVRAPEPPSNDSAYLCGLLGNLGLLAMIHVFEEDMGRVLTLSAITPEVGLAPIERDILGVDHHQVGGWLADRWHLPPEVVVVMEHHHEPDYRGPRWAHALLVGACARLADGALERDEVSPPLPEEFSVLGIGEEGLSTLGRVFGQRLAAIREIASTMAETR